MPLGHDLERALGDEHIAAREQRVLDAGEEVLLAEVGYVDQAEFVGQSLQLDRIRAAEGGEVHAREWEVLWAAGPRDRGRGRGGG